MRSQSRTSGRSRRAAPQAVIANFNINYRSRVPIGRSGAMRADEPRALDSVLIILRGHMWEWNHSTRPRAVPPGRPEDARFSGNAS